MPPGADCIINILGVFARSKLSYANKTQKEALKNIFLTLVGPHFSMVVFTRVLCTLPFKAFECRKTRKTSKIASRAGKMQLFEGK